MPPWRRAPTGRASTFGRAGKGLSERCLTETLFTPRVGNVPPNTPMTTQTTTSTEIQTILESWETIRDFDSKLNNRGNTCQVVPFTPEEKKMKKAVLSWYRIAKAAAGFEISERPEMGLVAFILKKKVS